MTCDVGSAVAQPLEFVSRLGEAILASYFTMVSRLLGTPLEHDRLFPSISQTIMVGDGMDLRLPLQQVSVAPSLLQLLRGW